MAARERLFTVTGNPAFRILRAMDLPMIPRPMYPTLSIIREIIARGNANVGEVGVWLERFGGELPLRMHDGNRTAICSVRARHRRSVVAGAPVAYRYTATA